MPTRRDLLEAIGATAATGLGLGSATGLAAADAVDARDAFQPDHVTLAYEQSTLERYRPLLDVSGLEFTPNALYGWVARSSEFDTAVAVYFAEYDAQRGWTPSAWAPFSDSHDGDHEPVYVEFEDSDVVGVAYDGFHWLRQWRHASELEFHDDTHPKLEVVDPWHFYRPTTASLSGFVDLADLTAVFESWLKNGLDAALDPGTTVNPYTMVGATGRPDWWRDDRAETARFALELGEFGFGLGGADKAEVE